MRYLSELFWWYSCDAGTLASNDSGFLVCLSVRSFAYFCTEIRQMLGYLQFWMRYLSEIFGDIPGMLLHHFQIILNFLYVCQSVSWLTSLLKLDKYRHISGPEWDIFLKIFGGIPWMFVHLFQIILKFLYVCQSVIWLTSLLKLHKYR